MKAGTMVSLVDCEENQHIGFVFAKELSKNDLRIGRLWKIKGRFWRLASAAHVGTHHTALGFEAINRDHLRSRPWCHDGIWAPPRRKPGE